LEGQWVSTLQITKDILERGAAPCHFHDGSGEEYLGNHIQGSRLIAAGDDRRGKRRFPIEQEVRYKMLYGQRFSEAGAGKTMNISSGGIWFSTENMLTSGTPIELSLTWPVLLNDSCLMKLMIYGCVVRSNRRGAAVAIERYEFRTLGRSLQNEPRPSPGWEYRIHF
jgi:hypothetical protein